MSLFCVFSLCCLSMASVLIFKIMITPETDICIWKQFFWISIFYHRKYLNRDNRNLRRKTETQQIFELERRYLLRDRLCSCSCFCHVSSLYWSSLVSLQNTALTVKFTVPLRNKAACSRYAQIHNHPSLPSGSETALICICPLEVHPECLKTIKPYGFFNTGPGGVYYEWTM